MEMIMAAQKRITACFILSSKFYYCFAGLLAIIVGALRLTNLHG